MHETLVSEYTAMAVSNKKLTEDLALATKELSAIVQSLAIARNDRLTSDADDAWSSTPSSEEGSPGLQTTAALRDEAPPVVVSALHRVSGKVNVRREESHLLKTTGGVDERQKTIEKFRSSNMPVDVFRLRRECVSGNSIEELISDFKSMQKDAFTQLDRDYIQTNVRQAAKVALPTETMRKIRKSANAHDVRVSQAQDKHKEIEKEKAQIRVLSLSRDPVARQTVAAYRAIPVSVVSSSQAAASPLLNQDPARRWASVLVAATFAGQLGGAAESLVLKRKRDEAWMRFHSIARQVCCGVHWRHRARRAKKAIQAWMFAVRCMRFLRKHWRRRREQRSAEIVKTLVMNALNAGKARLAIRRFLQSTRHIQTAWKEYLQMQEDVVRRWNKTFLEVEYKYLNSVFKEHKEGRAIDTKDLQLQEIIKKANGDRASRVFNVEEPSDSEPSTPRNHSFHPAPVTLAGPSPRGRRRAAIRVDAGALLGGGGSMHEWAAAQTHRQVEKHRLKEATRFAILASEFHNRMRGRADAWKALVTGFGNYAVRVKEFYEFLGFFGIKPEKADRSSLAAIKAQYEQVVADMTKSGALSSIKQFPDMMTLVTHSHRNYGTILVVEKQVRDIEVSSGQS